MPDITAEAIQKIQDLTESGLGSKIPEGGNTPYVVIPANCKVERLGDLIYNDHQKNPDRVRAQVGVLDPESFIEYYTLFSDENSRVFAYEPNISVLGVLDYHGKAEGGPRWCQHRLTLTLRESEQWTTWKGQNNKRFTQSEFAEFLEQNAVDITNPAPAAIIEVARDLQGTTEVEFGAGVRMNDGSITLKYTEATKATVGGNAIAVPERFVLTIPVFISAEPIDVDVLLRYRVEQGKLKIYYTMVRPEEARRQAFLAARNQIADKLKINIINGTPQS